MLLMTVVVVSSLYTSDIYAIIVFTCLFVCLFVCLLEQAAGHVMDVVGMKKIHFLICQHAAKCTEVRTSLVGLRTCILNF